MFLSCINCSSVVCMSTVFSLVHTCANNSAHTHTHTHTHTHAHTHRVRQHSLTFHLAINNIMSLKNPNSYLASFMAVISAICHWACLSCFSRSRWPWVASSAWLQCFCCSSRTSSSSLVRSWACRVLNIKKHSQSYIYWNHNAEVSMTAVFSLFSCANMCVYVCVCVCVGGRVCVCVGVIWTTTIPRYWFTLAC